MKSLGWRVGAAILVGLGAPLVVAGTLALDRPDMNDPRFKTISGSEQIDASSYVNFRDYVKQTRNHLETNKVFMNPATTSTELEAATPFELLPNAACQTARPTRGILLIHGLSDMPFAMRDLAEAFADRCFTVRVMLLPGHGTRPADLLEVSHRHWSSNEVGRCRKHNGFGTSLVGRTSVHRKITLAKRPCLAVMICGGNSM